MSLPCPDCGRNTLLAVQLVALVPDDLPAYEGVLWGHPVIPGEQKAFCNTAGCSWHGTIAEARVARRATLDVGPESG